ncbi:MAG TPA: hypothetical protein VJZ71_06280 [Phycisphaerae bacterium]|nr:hypothetical protein [Phycisphaerae bacterium]
MKRIATALAFGILTTSLLASTGCAFFTTKRVATTVGKHVVKKGYEKFKEDREEKKRQEQEQRVEQTSYEEPESPDSAR